jgi:hypothetical protein
MIAALLGRLVSPVVYIPLILLAVAGLYGRGYLKGFNEGKDRSALLFERALTKAQQEADTRVQEALDAAEDAAAIPVTDAQRVSLCARDAACRDRQRQ